jgi:6-phosphogluconolactonase (cycloisomerase 2 family)
MSRRALALFTARPSLWARLATAAATVLCACGGGGAAGAAGASGGGGGSGGAGAQGGSGGEGDPCGAGTTACGETCVNLVNDPAHCGACFEACALGEVCSVGSCGTACGAGTTLCNGLCFDTDLDPNHCGGCFEACAQGEACVGGVCELVCVGGTLACDGDCVDPALDPQHCGGCDIACAPGQGCFSGSCAPNCGLGTTPCGGTCVDTDWDPNHCGACDLPCEGQTACILGTCKPVCGVETTLCNGQCVDLWVDPENCGGCNQPCQPGESCVLGACTTVCGPGVTLCSGECVDTDFDPSHCGGCDLACPAGEWCNLGGCSGTGCIGGQTLCDGSCFDLLTSEQHCGGCATSCNAGEACVGGTCAATPAGSFAYVLNDTSPNTITGYAVSSDGALTLLPGSPFDTGGISGFDHHPDAIEVCGDFVYATNSLSGTIAGFLIGANGALTPVPGSPFASFDPVSLACSGPAAGGDAFLFVTDFQSNVRRYAILPSGALDYSGSAITGSNALGLTFDPTFGRLFVAGWSVTASVFDVDPATGALTPGGANPTLTGGNNHSASVSPSGQLVATEGVGGVRIWSVDAGSVLTQIPGSPFADPTPCPVVGLAWAPSGDRLFVGHRNCSPGRVMVYDVAASGALTPVAGAPFATGGTSPVGLAVSAAGTKLFVTHLASNLTSVLDVAPSGALTPVQGSPFVNPSGGFHSWIALR